MALLENFIEIIHEFAVQAHHAHWTWALLHFHWLWFSKELW